jgi:GT2 family glycosyltransferase
MSPPRSLAVSVVVYHPDLEQLRLTLQSLSGALRRAAAADALAQATVHLIDNGSDEPAVLDRLAEAALGEAPWLARRTWRGHGNVGYGRGHNLAIQTSSADMHLVLNPDVELAPDALVRGLDHLAARPGTVLVAPEVRDPAGGLQYLCRRYPSVLVLAVRAFAPSWLRRVCGRRLADYEMRDAIGPDVVTGIPLASGCFMLVRGDVLRRVGGFSNDYFLYYEDYDLSLRLRREGDIAYDPAVRIVHAGGGAARKGWRHQRMFLRSGVTFFRTHGWKLV